MSLTEKTMIPLGLAVATIGGAAMWLTTIQVTATANGSTLDKIMHKQEIYADKLFEIQVDISEIKGQLKRIRRWEK